MIYETSASIRSGLIKNLLWLALSLFRILVAMTATDRLRSALAERDSIERELGSGGMAPRRMRGLVRVVIPVALLLACVTPPRSSRGDTSSSAIELLRLESALNAAVARHDRASLDQILAEEFGLSKPDRAATPRDRWLANVERITVDSAQISEPQVSAWGDVAVVRTRQHFVHWRTAGVENPSDFRVTDLWVVRMGRWQLLRRYSETLR